MVKKLITEEELKSRISMLEIDQANEWQLLKQQLDITYDHLNPVNFVKNSIINLSKDVEVKSSLVTTSVGMIARLITKTEILGGAAHPIKQITVTILQILVSSLISKKGEVLLTKAVDLIQNTFNKTKPKT